MLFWHPEIKGPCLFRGPNVMKVSQIIEPRPFACDNETGVFALCQNVKDLFFFLVLTSDGGGVRGGCVRAGGVGRGERGSGHGSPSARGPHLPSDRRREARGPCASSRRRHLRQGAVRALLRQHRALRLVRTRGQNLQQKQSW